MAQIRTPAKSISIRAKAFKGNISRTAFLEKIGGFLDKIVDLRKRASFSKEFRLWVREVETLLCVAFGDDSAQVCDFKNVSYLPLIFSSSITDEQSDSCFYSGLDNAEIVLKSIRNEVIEYFSESEREYVEEQERPVSKEVFIVYGHNEELMLAVKSVIQTLGLNPIVLQEQPNEGMTLIQKFEKSACNAQFAIFLLTSDETVRVHRNGKEEFHSRQNVVFEMGYFFKAFKSKEGTHKGVFAILQEGVVKPGDVEGLVYQPYKGVGDNSWKLPLAKELQAAGLAIKVEKILEI